jgi:hypothetical protein
MPNPQTFHALRVHLIVSNPEVTKLSAAERAKHIEHNFLPALKTVNDLYNPPANQYLYYANIRFAFDPAKDVEYDAQVESFDGAALQRRAVLYRGKVVIFYRGHGGNAGSGADFFHLENLNGFNMAHELGHYLGLGHTHIEGRKLSDLPALVREAVEKEQPAKPYAAGHVTKIMNELMDGDAYSNNRWFWAKITDTPAALHSYDKEDEPSGFEYCEADFPVQVTFSNGHAHTYRFKPDMLNIMGYGDFGGCGPRYFSYQQIQAIHDIIESEDAPRHHLISVNPALKWSGWQEVQGGRTSDAAPAAAAFGNRLYVFAKGANGRIYINSALDGQPFGKWEEVQGNFSTNAAPAATAFGNRLYVFAKHSNNRIYVNSALDGQPFGNWAEVVGNVTTNAAPAAAGFGNRLYVFAKGIDDNRIYISSALDGQPFVGWAEVQGNGTTDAAPSAAVLGKRLYVFAKGIDDKRTYINSAADGQPFAGWAGVQGSNTINGCDVTANNEIILTELHEAGITSTTPAAAGFGNRLYVFAKGIKDNRIYFNAATDGQPFKGWVEVPGGLRTTTAPAAVAFGKRLYVFARGISDSRIYINSASLI